MAAANFPRDLGEMRRTLDEGANIYKNGLSSVKFSDKRMF